MTTKRILMVTYYYHPVVGGFAPYQKEIVDNFRNKNYVVDVLSVSSDGNMHIENDAHGTIIRLPKLGQIGSTVISLHYSYIYRKLAPDYDIVHFNFPNPMGEIVALRYRKKLRHVRKVVLYHADIVPEKRFSGIYNKLITSRFLKLMDHIIVSSPSLLEYSPHLVPVKQKVSVIPFGIDLNYFRPLSPNNHNNEKSPQSMLNILFVGRLSRYKGIDNLIRAMKTAPGRLTIVGNGPLKDTLIPLVNSLQLTDRVMFCGYLPDGELLEKYQQADLLVLPSTDAGEAFGYVLVEAMACRTALISTELKTGTSFVNADGETGLVVPPNDVSALSNAIRHLADNPDKLDRFKDQAVHRAHELFSRERMILETEQVYDNLE